MNKFLSRIAKGLLGLSLAAGGAIAVSKSILHPVKAVDVDFELFSGDLVEGDYLIVYDGVAMNTTVTSDRLQYTGVTISNDVISTSDASIIWHIAPSGDYWTIYNEDVAKYAASTGAKNKAAMMESGTDDKALWTASGSSTYEFVNKQNTANSVNATLRRNGTYGFACYATGTGGALSLYKKSSGSGSTKIDTTTVISVSSGSTTLDLADSTPTVQLSATVTGGGSTITSPTVTWSSDDTDVATVSSDGLVTGLRVGSVTITANYAGNSDYSSSSGTIDVNVENSAITERTFELIKSEDDLEVGAYYLIGNGSNGDVAFISNNQANNNRTAVTLSVADEKVSFTESTAEIIQLGGNSSDGWTFYATQSKTQGYLYAASSSSNYLRTQATNDDNGKWDVTVANTGAATATAKGSNSRKAMKYNANNGNPIFSCYASGDSVYFYKEVVQEDNNKILTENLLITGTLDDSAKTWVEGKTFTPTGLTIYAVYTDSDTYPNEDVTTLVSWSALSLGVTSVTGSFVQGDVTATCTIEGLTVVAKSPSSLSIASKTTSYMARTAFDLGEAVITLTYDNGEKATVAHDDSHLKIYLDNVDITSGYTFQDSDVGSENHTVKLEYTDNNKTARTSYTISVTHYVDEHSIERMYAYNLTLNETKSDIEFDGIYMGYVEQVISSVTYYNLYVGNGDFGMYVFKSVTEQPSYEVGKTYLTVKGNLKNYNYLYEALDAQVSVLTDEARKANVLAPTTYIVTGNEGPDILNVASRKTSLSGTVTGIMPQGGTNVTTEGSKITDTTKNQTVYIRVGENDVILYIKSAQITSDIVDKIVVGDELTAEGFSTFFKSGGNCVFEVNFGSIVEGDVNYHAADFARDLLKQTMGLCNANYDGVTNNKESLTSIWTTLDSSDYWLKVVANGEKATFVGADADKDIEVPTSVAEIQAMSDADALGAAAYRYDYCVAKYSLTNFTERSITVTVGSPVVFGTQPSTQSAVIIITVVSLVSVSSLTVLLVIKRRRIHQ